MNRIYDRSVTVLLTLWVCLASCVSSLPALPETVFEGEPLAVGHVQTVLLGPTTRWWLPELRFFEITHRASGHRFRIELESADGWFVVPLPSGVYGLDRVLFYEGAFQEASQLGLSFEVIADGVTYVGTWRFGMEPAHDQRRVVWSAVAEPEAVIHDRLSGWRALNGAPLTMTLPIPAVGQTQLHEVPPYPRVWFFRRHQTT